MKREVRLFSIFLISLILVSLIAGIAAAQTADELEEASQQAAAGAAETAGQTAKTAATNIWQKLFGGVIPDKLTDETKAMISKILLMILLVMIVYSLMGFIPFFDNENVKWIAAIITSILSFIFVSADNIKYIVANYEALGIILTSILPFLIIIAFTVKLREAEWDKDAFASAAAGFIIKIVIIGFAAYVGMRWYSITMDPLMPATELSYLYPFTLLGAIIWVLIEKKVWKYIHRGKGKGVLDKTTEVTITAATEEKLEALKAKIKAGESLSPKDEMFLNAHGVSS